MVIFLLVKQSVLCNRTFSSYCIVNTKDVKSIVTITCFPRKTNRQYIKHGHRFSSEHEDVCNDFIPKKNTEIRKLPPPLH